MGVIPALDFLREINDGGTPYVGDKVIVVGGGSTAFDASRSALRLGASEVSILYRRSKWDMPALPEEKVHAIEEGINIYDYVAPVEVIADENGVMKGLRCIRMAKGQFDESARRKSVPIKGSEFRMDADTLLIAIGAQGEVEGFREIGVTDKKTFSTDPITMETSIEGVFAGGDCSRGPETVIKAIADGRRAALSIDQFLGGDKIKSDEEQADRQLYVPIIETEKPRLIIPVLDPDDRKKGFQEIELPFDGEKCREEAFRCLRCDVK
jgi:NADPH-dependent glutamate synthase beta subunit-like oxidoreductase